MLMEDLFPQCLICTNMNTYCKELLWCHIIDGFTVCMPVTATHRALKLSCRPLPADLHVACLKVPFFAWNLCIQTQPHDIHLVPETEWITPVRVGTASPGAARFPSHCGRLGCTLRGGTCACQMLFSLSFPNLLISFCSEQTKSPSEPENPVQATFLFAVLVSLAHCIICVNDKDKKCVFSCFYCPSCVLKVCLLWC